MTDCYCVVLRKATRRVTAIYDQALEPAGINVAQLSLLRKIARNAPVSLTELGRLLELDRSTVGRNVRVVERLGFAVLALGDDQREATVSLTPRGNKVLAKAAPLWDAAQSRIETAVGSTGVDTLTRLLAEL